MKIILNRFRVWQLWSIYLYLWMLFLKSNVVCIACYCGQAIAATFKLRVSDSRRCRAWNSFPKSCFKVHGTMDTAHYISPFAISLRLMVDTHRGTTRERRPRVAGCIPSVVLTNVRPKIRLTGPGPAFTSPPLQRSPAPFLVSRRSSRSAFNFNTYVRNLTQRAEQSPNPFATWDKWKLCATPKHFCHCWRCHESRLRIDAHATYV